MVVGVFVFLVWWGEWSVLFSPLSFLFSFIFLGGGLFIILWFFEKVWVLSFFHYFSSQTHPFIPYCFLLFFWIAFSTFPHSSSFFFVSSHRLFFLSQPLHFFDTTPKPFFSLLSPIIPFFVSPCIVYNLFLSVPFPSLPIFIISPSTTHLNFNFPSPSHQPSPPTPPPLPHSLLFFSPLDRKTQDEYRQKTKRCCESPNQRVKMGP